MGVRLTCPRAVRRPCAGGLTIALATAGAPHPSPARYSIRAGSSAVVHASLTASERKRLRRAGTRSALVTSTEKGLHGAETVIRHVEVRG